MREIIGEIETYNIDELLKEEKLTDMMRQYLTLKKQYMDCILMSRVGDFYEIYFNDALEISKLGFKTTKKHCGLEIKIAQCGFPYDRNVNENINKILEKGYKIAVCEQLEDPKNKKGSIVQRDVIRIITPGTILDEDLLFETNNFLSSVVKIDNMIGFSYVDISTGEVFTSSFDISLLKEELSRVKPIELIILDKEIEESINSIIENYGIYVNNHFSENNTSILKDYFSEEYINTLEFPIGSKESLMQLFNYVFYTQKKIAKNLNFIEIYNVSQSMLLDSFTRDSLELTNRMRTKDKYGSLFYILDKTNTAMGARKLKQRIEQPFVNKEQIEKKLDLTEDLCNDRLLSDNLTKILKRVYDIERLCGRIAFERVNPREVVNLKKSIEELPWLKQLVLDSDCKYLKEFINKLDTLDDIFILLENALLETPSFSVNDGYIFKDSYHQDIDKYRKILSQSELYVKQLETTQKNILGINVLTIGNNKDGYYLDITKKNLENAKIPNDYKKIKDLSGTYRFTFPELQEFEANKLQAEDKLYKLEYELFVDLRNQLVDNISRMKETAKLLAELDVYLSLSKVAIENNYTRPNLNEDNILMIKNGRHPVIEKFCKTPFIGNDIYMDENKLIHIITGPNMSGKSTYMRQVALITLMSQIGSFVPCDKANISICDRIFTRIGASDNLANGESTFMVEMNELSQILNNATNKSFVLLDEVGRGTSTFDGVSIAQATVEYISKYNKCHTLFATHYFELITLEDTLDNVKNYKVEVEENYDEILFLRKVVEGSSTKSYGIQVAKTANMPIELINRAKIILKEFESQNNTLYENNKHFINKIKELPINTESNIDNKIKELDLTNMTPMDALLFLNQLQKQIKRG